METQELVQQIGKFIQYFGFKEVHGRIWAVLFISKQPLDAADIMKRLKISKGLVSITIKDLLQYDVVRVSGKSRKGTTLYVPNPDVVGVITNVLRNREQQMLQRISLACANVRKLPAEEMEKQVLDPAQLQVLQEMVDLAKEGLSEILGLGSVELANWKKFHRTTPPA